MRSHGIASAQEKRILIAAAIAATWTSKRPGSWHKRIVNGQMHAARVRFSDDIVREALRLIALASSIPMRYEQPIRTNGRYLSDQFVRGWTLMRCKQVSIQFYGSFVSNHFRSRVNTIKEQRRVGAL